jgi:PhzF family phenazine biosynthesis protein
MSGIPLWQVDAFTSRPFAGNPAAVCWLESPASAAWMQSVAAEMNLAETAFVEPRANSPAEGYALRWFTPEVEVPLCGHATLASAHVLWESGRHSAVEPIVFHTQSGPLTCRQRDGRIEMDFPLAPAEPAPPPSGLYEALGVNFATVMRTPFDYLVIVQRAEVVRRLAPDFRKLAQVQTRGVIVTSRSDDERYDFVSRFFAPAVGIDEDPVTGSAHCALAPYWAEILGKMTLTGWQASRRGGEVRVAVFGDRVLLAGEAVTVLRGELCGELLAPRFDAAGE